MAKEKAKHWRVLYDSGTMSCPMSKAKAKALAKRLGAKKLTNLATGKTENLSGGKPKAAAKAKARPKAAKNK